VGEPGIGKTHFAQGLAKALSAPLSIQRLDSGLTETLLLGSDKRWGNSQPGLLFELLVLGAVVNPIIVLDEIDKINSAPTGPIQPLLGPGACLGDPCAGHIFGI
jgi:ATP-dependent Lon protease